MAIKWGHNIYCDITFHSWAQELINISSDISIKCIKFSIFFRIFSIFIYLFIYIYIDICSHHNWRYWLQPTVKICRVSCTSCTEKRPPVSLGCTRYLDMSPRCWAGRAGIKVRVTVLGASLVTHTPVIMHLMVRWRLTINIYLVLLMHWWKCHSLFLSFIEYPFQAK